MISSVSEIYILMIKYFYFFLGKRHQFLNNDDAFRVSPIGNNSA